MISGEKPPFDKIARVDGFEIRMDRLEGRLDRVEDRLGAVEQKLSDVDGKLSVVVSQIASMETHFGQQIASQDARLGQMINKLPSWWQMPAVTGATVARLVASYSVAEYLHVAGRL